MEETGLEARSTQYSANCLLSSGGGARAELMVGFTALVARKRHEPSRRPEKFAAPNRSNLTNITTLIGPACLATTEITFSFRRDRSTFEIWTPQIGVHFFFRWGDARIAGLEARAHSTQHACVQTATVDSQHRPWLHSPGRQKEHPTNQSSLIRFRPIWPAVGPATTEAARSGISEVYSNSQKKKPLSPSSTLEIFQRV